jgi:hypothetical protein
MSNAGRRWKSEISLIPYVEAFCGIEVAQSFSDRLDANGIARYRRKLRDFYHHVFVLHDPALPIRGELGLGRVELSERYVLPDLNVRASSVSSSPAKGEEQQSTKEAVRRLREDVQPILPPSTPRISPLAATRMP